MSNTDQNQPTLSAYVKMLFSSSTLSALRATLLACSPLLAIFGVSGLTPDKINAWVAYAQTFGTAALAVIALLGVVVPLVVAIIGILASTVKRQIARVRELAENPQLASAAAAKALTDATAQLAKSGDVQKSADAVNALVSATIALPQVQTIVADKATADAAPSENVVAAEKS